MSTINPATGYRFLTPGELTQMGDEYRPSPAHAWRTTAYWGRSVGPANGYYRRKVATPEPGYRFLNPGERVEATDEYQSKSGGPWLTTAVSGEMIRADATCRYRRKIVAAPAYRTLSVDEKIQPGDEYLSPVTGEWIKTSCPGMTVHPVEANKYRRKVTPDIGEGYRALEIGEVLQYGDEFWSLDNRWEATICAGDTVRPHLSGRYQRKVTQPAPGEVEIGSFSLEPANVLTGPKLWAIISANKVIDTAATYDALEKALIARNGKGVTWHLANGFRVAQVAIVHRGA